MAFHLGCSPFPMKEGSSLPISRIMVESGYLGQDSILGDCLPARLCWLCWPMTH